MSTEKAAGLQQTPDLCFHVIITVQLKAVWADPNSVITSDVPECSVDSSKDQTADSHLNPAGCFPASTDVSDGKGWRSEQTPEQHS